MLSTVFLTSCCPLMSFAISSLVGSFWMALPSRTSFVPAAWPEAEIGSASSISLTYSAKASSATCFLNG
jgi:hypothetical protein